MAAEEVIAELAPHLKTLLQEAKQVAGNGLSVAALGVAGGAGAVYALEHHGRVRTAKATHRHKS